MRYLFFLLLIFIAISATSCWGIFNKPAYEYKKKWAWKPVYSADTANQRIIYTADTPVVNAGKIYVKDNYIYQCEIGAGIHVTDNTNPATAKRIGFIRIPGCEEISIKGNILYTNNYYDLVAVDISTLATPQLLSRTKNAFYGNGYSSYHSWEQPKSPGYYQCPSWYPDSVILNWVLDSVYADCYK